jgi:stalled ribosome rescue protein Dom34
MKNLGIWLDKKKARIISLENEKEVTDTIVSEVEDFRIHGGSGTKFKGGPQDVVQDSKYLEREKHQLKSYFKEIASKMKDANAVVIFGPAQTKEKLRKELQENYKDLNAKVIAVKTADNMTDNQIRAFVRNYFN